MVQILETPRLHLRAYSESDIPESLPLIGAREVAATTLLLRSRRRCYGMASKMFGGIESLLRISKATSPPLMGSATWACATKAASANTYTNGANSWIRNCIEYVERNGKAESRKRI